MSHAGSNDRTTQLTPIARVMLAVGVACQLATVILSWPVWHVRDLTHRFPNLPWIDGTPQFDTQWLLVGSLVLVLISPRRFGMALHLVVLSFAIGMDQIRFQPQFIANAVLMAACVWPAVRRACVWYLISIWIWAGLHKLLSPEWFANASYNLLVPAVNQYDPWQLWRYHSSLAIVVAICELGLGLLAIIRPRLAAVGCIPMHAGIVMFLFWIDWNYSVVPWNVVSAIVGCWLLLQMPAAGGLIPQRRTEWVAVALIMIVPAGYYLGLVRVTTAIILYSRNMAEAVVTTNDGIETFKSIPVLGVPYPHEPSAARQYLAQKGVPGDKLHVHDPRDWIGGHWFYKLAPAGRVQEIDRDAFVRGSEHEVGGILLDDGIKFFQLAKTFHLERSMLPPGDPARSRILKRAPGTMAWAITFNPRTFEQSMMEQISGLPNLEEIQLSGCEVMDEDLQYLSGLYRLAAIGLDNTAITDAGLEHLRGLPNLEVINHEGTAITDGAVQKLLRQATESR